ncbi:hypothetical protein [Burkholderia sp. RF4-BP95]|uniref:hypothetical protein n=1 Tax=Burkholderia sp. RF4-BP95 TaxID=1637845 RepID=UPI0012E3DD05|nr:hypothetical protein [Burkholderia sp. RF4-BP95]
MAERRTVEREARCIVRPLTPAQLRAAPTAVPDFGPTLACDKLWDRLAEVDQGAIVDHKRLSHTLQVAQAFQAQRDSRRIGIAPSRTHRGLPVRMTEAQPGTRKPRRFTAADMETAILEIASEQELSGGPRRPAGERKRPAASGLFLQR